MQLGVQLGEVFGEEVRLWVDLLDFRGFGRFFEEFRLSSHGFLEKHEVQARHFLVMWFMD